MTTTKATPYDDSSLAPLEAVSATELLLLNEFTLALQVTQAEKRRLDQILQVHQIWRVAVSSADPKNSQNIQNFCVNVLYLLVLNIKTKSSTGGYFLIRKTKWLLGSLVTVSYELRNVQL